MATATSNVIHLRLPAREAVGPDTLGPAWVSCSTMLLSLTSFQLSTWAVMWATMTGQLAASSSGARPTPASAPFAQVLVFQKKLKPRAT